MPNKKTLHYFKVNTPELLKEITENGARMGIFFVPINVFQNLLGQVADRAAKLNDPILNSLMCDLALYEVSNPVNQSKENKKIVAQVYRDAAVQRKKEQNHNLKQS